MKLWVAKPYNNTIIMLIAKNKKEAKIKIREYYNNQSSDMDDDEMGETIKRVCLMLKNVRNGLLEIMIAKTDPIIYLGNLHPDQFNKKTII